MTQKKNNLLTYLFALIPGAGQMYLGFMKLGTSIMILFFGLCYLEIPLLVPVLWFYAFFDTINKINMDPEEFYQLEDNYLFSENSSSTTFSFLQTVRGRQLLGIVFLLVGFRLVWSTLMSIIVMYIPNEIYQIISEIAHTGTSLLIAALIIWIGIKLILNEKKHLLGSDDKE